MSVVLGWDGAWEMFFPRKIRVLPIKLRGGLRDVCVLGRFAPSKGGICFVVAF